MNKKKYVKPVSRLLPMELRLMEDVSVNTRSSNNVSVPSNKRGFLFRNEDVFSRESGDYWDDEEGDE